MHAGIQAMISRQDYINRINVFPVPDQDTGTNLAMTLAGILEKIKHKKYKTIEELMHDIADGALESSRGNSGAIVAQFLHGMHRASFTKKRIDADEFGVMLHCGALGAYGAISEPQAGTILTVMEQFAHKWDRLKGEKDFVERFELAIKTADRALSRTTKQLQVLKAAHVVDAGAQAFVDMLHGVMQLIASGDVEAVSEAEVIIPPEVESVLHSGDSEFRYCTECLIDGKQINHSDLRSMLEPLGDSLIVAGSAKKAKVHMHTDTPAQVMAICHQFGKTSGHKADDMHHQQDLMELSIKQHVAIVCDSSADLNVDIVSELDIYVVPLYINVDDTVYIDRITLDITTFCSLIGKHKITTSQPSFNNFKRAYELLSTHFPEIISIHLPKTISGTYQTAKKAGS